MFTYSYNDFIQAVKILNLIGIENRNEVKSIYLKLSKQYHPDMENGNIEKFQEINRAYKIIISYIDNFRFRFTEEEFKKQYSSFTDLQEWKHNNI